jgi:hypothetical protein
MNNWILLLSLLFIYFLALILKRGCNFISFFFCYCCLVIGAFLVLYTYKYWAHVSALAAFRRRVWLTTVVIFNLQPHHLMCLSIHFLFEWRVYSSELWFDANWLFFLLLSFPYLFLWIACWPRKKLYQPFNFFFDSVFLLLITIILFTLIIYDWILFLISSYIVWFC